MESQRGEGHQQREGKEEVSDFYHGQRWSAGIGQLVKHRNPRSPASGVFGIGEDMTNPIIVAIQQLAPGYVIGPAQMADIARNPDPEQQAEALPGLVESMAHSLAENCPEEINWREVPVAWMLAMIDFQSFRISRMVSLNELGSKRGFLLGVIVGRNRAVTDMCKHNKRYAEINARYLKVFGRIADPAGLGFYDGTDLSLDEIEADMRKNKAQGAG